MKGPGGPAPPVLDQNEARRPEKKFFLRPPPPPPYLRVWMTAPPFIWRSGSATAVSSQGLIVLKTNLYGTVQAFLMSYGICLGV